MDYLAVFGSILLLSFGICLIIGGIFTAYFGTGKSRAIGGILIALGVIFFGVLYYLMTYNTTTKHVWNLDVVYTGISAVIGAAVGAIAAIGIFLLSIMKT